MRKQPLRLDKENSLVTFKLRPSAAMMKENSPICASPMPTRSAVLSFVTGNEGSERAGDHLTHHDHRGDDKIGPAYLTRSVGSMSRPMETKKTALNMSRSGSISASIRRIWRASAMMAPIRNAPSATLYSSFTASNETPKQSPRRR